jgi:hypothetical protein
MSPTIKKLLLVLLAATIATLACSLQSETATPTAVIEEQPEQVVEEPEAAAPEAESPTPFPAQEVCDPLAALASQYLGLTFEIQPNTFPAEASGLGGEGCTVSLGGTGAEVTDWGQTNQNFLTTLPTTGWEEDIMFSGGGAGGLLNTYRKAGYVCRYISEAKPVDMSLCGEEALAACMARLEPEQQLYSVTLDCSQDQYVPAEEPAESQVDPEPVRVEFQPYAISWYTPGDLPANGVTRFVLWAMEGQQMNINLNSEPGDSAILIIWGADGTVLISDHAGATAWSGILPASQDYYIDVRSTSPADILYTLEVVIPPPVYSESQPEPLRIEFQPNATSWDMNGELIPDEIVRFVLKAMEGQQMTINLASKPQNSATMVVWGADGTLLASDRALTTNWTGLLPATQDYYVEVRSLASDDITYSLQVIIP